MPLFRLFHKGGRPAKYGGKHDLQQVLHWLAQKIGVPGPYSKITSHAALKTKVGDIPNLAVYIGKLKFEESGKTRIRPEFMKF